MNFTKPTSGIKNQEASVKNPLLHGTHPFTLRTTHMDPALLKTGLSRGISRRAPGVKPNICYFGLREL